jgi:hypothetical protein
LTERAVRPTYRDRDRLVPVLGKLLDAGRVVKLPRQPKDKRDRWAIAP